MCCNRTNNNNNNVLGAEGRRRCCRDNGNVLGVTRIALRGPGCISGTGRCGRFTADFVEGTGGFEDECFRVSPDRGSRRCNRRDCECTFRCLFDLLSDADSPTCPR